MTKRERAAERKRRQDVRDFLAQPSRKAPDHPAPSTAQCPRCNKPCPVLPHDSAHCTQCMAGFRVTS